MIVSCLVQRIVCGTLYLSVTSFFPLYVGIHFPEINATLISICMTAFEFSGCLFGPFHPVTMTKIGRKNSIIYGAIILVFTTTSMGLLSVVELDWQTFICLSTAVRFIQGFADSLCLTAIYSIVCNEFDD